MTPGQLDAIRQRAAKATPGPWEWSPDSNMGCGDVYTMHPDHIGGPIAEPSGDLYPRSGYSPKEDMIFIAHARTDVTDLLDEIDCLRADLASLHLEADKREEKAGATLLTEIERLKADLDQAKEWINHGGERWTLLADVDRLNAELLQVRGEVREAIDYASNATDSANRAEAERDLLRAELAEAKRRLSQQYDDFTKAGDCAAKSMNDKLDQAERRGWHRGWDEHLQRQTEFDNRICQFIPEHYEANYNPIEEWATDAYGLIQAVEAWRTTFDHGAQQAVLDAVRKINPSEDNA